MQAISTVLLSLAKLGLSIESHDWQRLMHRLLECIKADEVGVEWVAAVIWSGTMWGRMEDPSTLDVIKAIRTRVEQSRRLAASLGDVSAHQALAQVCWHHIAGGNQRGR
jgi:hypothetical protein